MRIDPIVALARKNDRTRQDRINATRIDLHLLQRNRMENLKQIEDTRRQLAQMTRG